jgi:hypothetical protein
VSGAAARGADQIRHHDAIIITMRTTLNLPEDVYEIARSLAHLKNISLGEAIADLVRSGLRPSPAGRGQHSIFPQFSVSPQAPPITLEHTLELEDEL